MAAAAVAGLTTAVYLAIIREQGNVEPGIFVWAGIMLVGTALALAAALVQDRRDVRWAALGAAVVLGPLGLISILSVGLGFLIAAGLALAAFFAIPPPERDGTPVG